MQNKTYVRPKQWREKISIALKRHWDSHPEKKIELSKKLKGKELTWQHRMNIKKYHADFRGDKNSRWKGGCLGYGRIKSHRVWEEYWHEKVPDGYILHHIDGNILNNNIWNLAMVTRSTHKKIEYRHYHRWKKQLDKGFTEYDDKHRILA